MRILFIFAVICLNMPNSHAQKNKIISITFHPMYGNESLKTAGQYYTSSGGDSISIETCKFYVSAIEFLKADRLVWSERNSYHLINAFDINTLFLHVESSSKIVFDQISLSKLPCRVSMCLHNLLNNYMELTNRLLVLDCLLTFLF